MKTGIGVLAAGGAFAALAIGGLLVGIYVAQRSGQPLWALGGLFAGAALGAYSALRLLLRSIR